MEIGITEFKRLSEKQKEKLNEAAEYIKKKGNFGQTLRDEEKIRSLLKLSPNICPCEICKTVANRKAIESYSLPQLMVYKANDFNEDNLRFIIAPFRHMSNEEFLVSPVWGFVSRVFSILQNIIMHQYNGIKKFEMKMDNTYGTYQQEVGEHGHLSVTFFKE